MMGDKAGRSTALLDLDIHFGTGALALDLEPGRGLTDAIENPSRIDGLFIERAMVRANEKLCVLSAEAPLNQPLLNDGTAFFQLQEELRNAFESTVLDLPRSMLIQHPHLVQDVHVAIVAVEFTLAATRDAIRVLSWLKANAPHVQGARRRQPGPVGRAGDQPQGFRAVDRAFGRRRHPVRAEGGGAGGQARPALRQGRDLVEGRRARWRSWSLSPPRPSRAARAAPRTPKEGAKSLLDKLNLKGLVAKKPKPATA